MNVLTTLVKVLSQEISADDYRDRAVTFRGDLRTAAVAGGHR